MKVLGDFNKISDKLKKTIPVLEPGEIRFFRMLTGVTNPDPDPNENAKRPILYGAWQIRTKDRIRDPFITNDEGKEVGGYVDIGVVEEFDTKTNNVTKTRLFIPGQDTGVFSLMGGNIDDEEMFEYLWICNENGKNPYRDKKVKPLFEEIDQVAESVKEAEGIDALIEAMQLLATLSKSDMKKLSEPLGLQVAKNDETILESKIKVYAKSFPSDFVKICKKAMKKSKETQPELISS